MFRRNNRLFFCCFAGLMLIFLDNLISVLDSHKEFVKYWKKIQKPLLNNSPSSRLRPYILTVSCFYCMKRGHFVRFCRVRKICVPRGVLKWFPRNPKNSKAFNESINANGPKFVRGPNLATWSCFLAGTLKSQDYFEVKNEASRERIWIGF